MGRLVPPTDGTSASVADVEIMVRNRTNQRVEFLRTDRQGWFAFTGDSTASYQLSATDTSGYEIQSEVIMGTAAGAHKHDEGIHIPFYVYIAILMLLSSLITRRLETRPLSESGS
jgi:hypothetical protein